MTIAELGALGEFFGSILTLATLAYLAIQIRQNTTQQKREELVQLWAGFAVAIVAPVGIRQWWEEEDGKLGFHTDVREMIDERLNDSANPPTPITEMWTSFNPEAWESAQGQSVGRQTIK